MIACVDRNVLAHCCRLAYDDLGRRTGLTRGNGVATSYVFDDLSRLTTLAQDLASTAADVTFSFGYNAAGQILTRGATNAAYNPPSPSASTTGYVSNGLNQHTSAGGVTLTYDTRGNLTGDGAKTYGYDVANRLTSVTGATLASDALGRLTQVVSGGVTTKFLYDGDDLIAELDGAGTLLRRYVHGPAVDEPLVWYEGSGTTDRRWLVADDLGSVIAVTDGSGASTATNTYDEYGVPGASNAGRFQYTGQTWLSAAGLYHYKARAYNPQLGRFMQTDPIGYDDGMNMYAYVGNDPVNWRDPWGLEKEHDPHGGQCAQWRGCTPSGDPYTELSGINVWGIRLFTGEIPAQGPQQRPSDGGSGGGGGKKGIKIRPSDEYLQCLASNVPEGGVAAAAAGALLGAMGAPIVPKGRVGLTGGGPSGRWTSPFSKMSRSIFTKNRPGSWLNDIGEFMSGGSRSANVGANVGRIGSRLSGPTAVGIEIKAAEQLIQAAKQCAATNPPR